LFGIANARKSFLKKLSEPAFEGVTGINVRRQLFVGAQAAAERGDLLGLIKAPERMLGQCRPDKHRQMLGLL
jgi:hypothetical protein